MTIFLAEPSNIIRIGIKQIIINHSEIRSVYEYTDCNLLADDAYLKKPSCIIANPAFLQSSGKTLKELFPATDTKFIALVYSYIDNAILEQYDAVIYINDSNIDITTKLKQTLKSKKEKTEKPSINLTKREIDVLKSVVLGLTNNEIADKLSISSHTVVSHRKNINAKLGIKSVSGLTVYAIINKLVRTEEIEEAEARS